MSLLPSPLVVLLVSSLLISLITAQSDDSDALYRNVRAPKLIRFGRAGPKLVRFGKRSDPGLTAEEYDAELNEMLSAYKRGGPKLVRFG